MPTIPTSLSTLGSVHIFLDPKQGDQEGSQPMIPGIVPIGATATTLHYFGTPGIMRHIKFKCYSVADKNTLKGYSEAGTTVALVTHRGAQGSWVIRTISFAELNALNYADAWYDCTAELIAQ